MVRGSEATRVGQYRPGKMATARNGRSRKVDGRGGGGWLRMELFILLICVRQYECCKDQRRVP